MQLEIIIVVSFPVLIVTVLVVLSSGDFYIHVQECGGYCGGDVDWEETIL